MRIINVTHLHFSPSRMLTKSCSTSSWSSHNSPLGTVWSRCPKTSSQQTFIPSSTSTSTSIRSPLRCLAGISSPLEHLAHFLLSSTWLWNVAAVAAAPRKSHDPTADFCIYHKLPFHTGALCVYILAFRPKFFSCSVHESSESTKMKRYAERYLVNETLQYSKYVSLKIICKAHRSCLEIVILSPY